MKDLLMIIPFFPPSAGGGVFRALSFVKYLPGHDWRTTVITPQSGAYWVTDGGLLDDIPESCVVHRTGTMSGQSVLMRIGTNRRQVRSSRGFGVLRSLGGFVLLPDTYIGWYPFAIRFAKKLMRQQRFDAIFSTSPPETSHVVASSLHKSAGVPWVADFRDPWTRLYVQQPPTPLHARINRSLEERVCMNATVVVTNQRYKEELQRRYPGMKPATVITNGYDHVKFDNHPESPPSDGVCRILHAGMLTDQRNGAAFLQGLRMFLDGEAKAADNLEVTFVGAREDENDRLVRRFGLEGIVKIHDGVSHSDSLKLMRRSDILLVIALPHQMPGKFFEYVGARKPILAVVSDGEIKHIVDRLRRGEVAAADEPETIAAKLRLMYAKYAAGTLMTDYDLSEVAEYQRERLTATLANCLDQLTS